jgi:hypothetical protein
MMMPSDVIAFGIDLATLSPYAGSFRIELDGIDVGLIIPTQPYPNRQFFGLQTDTPFSQVKIYNTSGQLYNTVGYYDNVSYIVASQAPQGGEQGAGTETPEVATLLTVATGLLVIGWSRRRPKRALSA